MQRTIRLESDLYRLSNESVQFFNMTPRPVDYESGKMPEYDCEWVTSCYKIGARAVLVSTTDVSPNAIRSGRNDPHYWLSFDLDGIGGNSNPLIKRTSGWRGTTNDRSVDAHGVVTIRKIRLLKNGDIAVTVS